ncbi:MAG: CHAD domain-containing protein [Rhizobiaceae bacterium]|nr:CHAD domain-containing protein [Rhizobiaceae bacterium]
MSFRINPHSSLGAEIRRIASEELEAALTWVSSVSEDPDKAFHEARKRLKNVRAVLGLVRSGDEGFVKEQNDRCRNAASRLAGPRQAGALIETVDRMTTEFPREADRKAMAALRERLLAHRHEVLAGDMKDVVHDAGEACRHCIERLAGLALPDSPEEGADVLATGASRALRRARRALRRARSEGDAEAFHDLRKAAKAHLAHLSLLKDFWPFPTKTRRKAVAALAERLGELQDIRVLRTQLREEFGATPEDTRRIERLCKRSERELRKECLAQAKALFSEKPRRSTRKMTRKLVHGLTEAQPSGN